MKLKPSGTSISTQKQTKKAVPPKRTRNKGWTKHAAIRNRNFLFSVVPQQLCGFGFSVTHTVDKCPTPELWAKWVKSYFKNIARKWPLTRYHSVTEWQRRGMPHLHAAVWFGGTTALGSGFARQRFLTKGIRPREIVLGKDIPYEHQLVALWLKITSEGGSHRLAQDVKPISLDDAGHWLKYLAKHGSRGVSNYQRHYSNVPKSWKGRTCQVWNKGGDWPTENSLEVHGLSQSEKYQVRRVFCRFLASLPPSHRVKAESRSSSRLYWKKFLSCSDLKTSRFRAPTAFIDLEHQVKLVLSVNPDAYFSDSETGEVFYSVEDMPINRTPVWEPPSIYSPPTDMSDIQSPS